MVPDTDRRLLSSPTRQSPLALLFIAWRLVRNIGIVNIGIGLVFVFSGRVAIGLWAVGVTGVTLVLALAAASWWRFTFVVEGSELVVTKGIVSTERLIIPLDRVQSVGIDQKLLHRPVGLVSASVDTAGSSTTELTIDAVGRDVAEALQRLASGAERSPDREGDLERVVVSRTPRELVRIGLTRLPWAGFIVLAPLIAILDELRDLVGVDLAPDEQTTDDVLGDASVTVVVLVVLAVLVLITLLGLGLQVLQEIFTNWDLTVVRTGDGLRRTAGLANTTSTASSLRRVQSITTDQSPPQRWFGIRRIQLTTVGEGTLAIPGSSEIELVRLREMVLDATSPPCLDRMVSPAFVLRATRNAALVVAPVMVGAWFAVGWWASVLLALVVVRSVVARRQWRLRRWGVGDGRIAESTRLVTERTREFELIKTQTVLVTRSFFERRRGLATLRVHNAEGSVTVPLIDHSDARAVRDIVLQAVESSRRPFM